MLSMIVISLWGFLATIGLIGLGGWIIFKGVKKTDWVLIVLGSVLFLTGLLSLAATVDYIRFVDIWSSWHMMG